MIAHHAPHTTVEEDSLAATDKLRVVVGRVRGRLRGGAGGPRHCSGRHACYRTSDELSRSTVAHGDRAIRIGRSGTGSGRDGVDRGGSQG